VGWFKGIITALLKANPQEQVSGKSIYLYNQIMENNIKTKRGHYDFKQSACREEKNDLY
jgi:hypothetical protein